MIPILLALGGAVLLLDAWAAWKLFGSPFYDIGQRWIQLALVLLLPVAGAWVVLYMGDGGAPAMTCRRIEDIQAASGSFATTLISNWKPYSQVTPTAVALG